MSSVRLWTFQDQSVADQLMAGHIHCGDWERTPENWRLAYRWMASSLKEIAPELGEHAPIWCWHSCHGTLNQPPTVGTAAYLLSESDFERGLAVLELAIPADTMLLSSYYAWNRFLDAVITKKRLPRSPRRAGWMFEEPLLRHADDDIQAVIPLIRPSWLVRSTPLIIDGRDYNEPLFPVD
jgi:hypothetical protein